MTKPVLYQFPVSHYCEKVRWALDYKHIAYETRNLLPLFHMPAVFRRTRQNKVPVLKLDGRYINESSVIIQTLDERFPSAPVLFPEDDAQREEALEWAAFADREIGPHLRRTAYFHVIDHSHVMFEILTEGQNTVGRMTFRASQPVVVRAMKEGMGINERGYARSLERLEAALDRLDARVADNAYLTGDRFSVADLTAASLLGPLARPPEAPFQFPDDLPPALTDFIDAFQERPSIDWVRRMYREHRGKRAS
ncbi:glutathione S-transferase family protein [Marinobacter bohaiensis]|uniref:glutathione S-transferase family protein n=1 Tax=Marinobacter bohaiensis TaxID=2201898 RepID=UPI000DABD026|nr:glutathione S-transferase family protein [Marinobacter bohaiensis]